MQVCPNCGAQNADESVFCGTCGSGLPVKPAEPVAAETAEAVAPVVEPLAAEPAVEAPVVEPPAVEPPAVEPAVEPVAAEPVVQAPIGETAAAAAAPAPPPAEFVPAPPPSPPAYQAPPPQPQGSQWVSYGAQPPAQGQYPPPPVPGQYPQQPGVGQYQQPYPGQPGQIPIGPAPKSNLGNAIFATLCCCMPAGIVAIIHASQVKSKWTMGDYAGAQKAAKNAQTWVTVAIVLGLLWVALAVIVQIAAPESTSSFYPY